MRFRIHHYEAALPKCLFLLKKKIYSIYPVCDQFTQADKEGHLEVSRSRPWLQKHSKLPVMINLIIN
jgi:hypothetical protein